MARSAAALLVGLMTHAPSPAMQSNLTPDSGRVPVEAGSVYYEVSGSGPALVLIHGGFGDRRMWDRQLESYARCYRVIRYDHRGFGRSSTPEAAYSAVDDLRRLLDHLGVQRAHVMGNSMGGALALEFALLEPTRVMKVVVVTSGANGFPHKPEEVQSVVRVFELAQKEGTARAVEMWLAHPMVAVASRDPSTSPLLRQMVEENAAVFRLIHWPGEPLTPPAFERLSAIRMPVLFMVGDRDTELVRRAARASADRVPGSEWVLVPVADHLPQMESALFDQRVLAFLGR